METSNITIEQYIQHEVELRVHGKQFALQDEKFTRMYNQLNNKLNVIMGFSAAIFTVVLIPIILHSLKLI
jgi:hypothetical protein